jgi:type I restriction enzyme S subunit
MPKDIRDGRVNEASVARITEQKAHTLSRHYLKYGSIIFPRRGEINKCAYIGKEQTGFLCGTGCIKIETPEDVLSSRFLYYYLGLADVVQWLERNAVGTTMLNLNTSILGGVQVPEIDIITQNGIAEVLSAYDNLIENNCRRIALLEESARLLYREWFVYLRFPGHEHVKMVDGVPEGWEKKTLVGKIILNYGKALKAESRIEGTIPVYGSSGIIGTHEKALVKGPGIVVGRKGNVGSVFWSDSDFYPIDTVYYIDSESSSFHLYHSLQNMQFISNDAAVPGLNRDFAYSRSYLVPAPMIAEIFEETVTPIYKQISKLKTYNKKLKQTRDLLLPRLMNGEIAV